jgi:hypothetical protein
MRGSFRNLALLALLFVFAGQSACASGNTAGTKGGAPAKAAGPNQYTVGEVYAKAADLQGKTIHVKGKVAKASAAPIMGRNWLHLQDGTGDPASGSHDLTVTSQDSAAVGDVVTARGVLGKDRDFGAGYKYKVILEEAILTR